MLADTTRIAKTVAALIAITLIFVLIPGWVAAGAQGQNPQHDVLDQKPDHAGRPDGGWPHWHAPDSKKWGHQDPPGRRIGQFWIKSRECRQQIRAEYGWPPYAPHEIHEIIRKYRHCLHADDRVTATPQSVVTDEDSPLSITLTAMDDRGESGDFYYEIVSGPAQGTLTGTAPDLVYTPNADVHGTDAFVFLVRVDETASYSSTATVDITINPVNDVPVANAQTVSTDEDSAVSIVLGGSDVDGDAITYAVVSGPTSGTLSGTAPDLTYTPNANYNGPDSFTFSVNDGTVDSAAATVTVDVAAVNDAPFANAQTVSTDEDNPVSVVLSGSDLDGDAITYTVVTDPTSGTLSGTAPDLTYAPNANYNGADSFTFTVNDGTVDSAAATVTIDVAPVNDAPVANAQTASTDEDNPVEITLSGSDIDGDAIIYAVVTGPTNGTLSGTAPDLTYTPNANYNGADSFTFTVNDGTVDSVAATVTVDVVPVNDAPVANAQTISTDEDNAASIMLGGSDIDGDAITYAVVTGPTNGTLSGMAPNLTYTPEADYNGADSFTFTVNDGTVDSSAATVAIDVVPVNDVPVANAQTISTDEDNAVSIVLSSSDLDGDTITYTVVSGPTNGTLSGTAPDLIYTPAANYNGPDSFTFTVNDGTVDSVAATVTIDVVSVNDAPVAVAGPDQTVDRGATVTLDGSASTDIDGDTLTYAWSFVSVPTGSGAAFSDEGAISPTFAADAAGTYEVQLTVSDGNLTSLPDTLTITANQQELQVPDVIGLLQADAEAAIVLAGLVVGTVTTQHSDTLPAGRVISQDPVADTLLLPGGTVSLVVSLGSATLTPPTVSLSAAPQTIALGESATLSWYSMNATSCFIEPDIGSVALSDSIDVTPEHTTTYTITAAGLLGTAGAQVTVVVTGAPEPSPEGSFGQLYDDLVPPDALLSEYDADRFALITGVVNDIGDQPLAGVSVTIHGHAEYGTVYTDDTGRFTLPVQGGGTLTVVYAKEGFITSHRQVDVPWNDIAVAETLQLIAQDPANTIVTFDGDPQTVIVHESTRVTDDFGSRSATMVFTGDNQAYAVNAEGNVLQALGTITTRATEFTTPESMPAVLPPTSAYTYCTELSVDGVQRVRFAKPVITWVDNFLGFDVGEIVPVGYYDRDKGVWMPSDNGVVVRLLDTDGDGVVDALDADGDDQPDDLDSSGAYTDEVTGLDDPLRYLPGTTYWRVAVSHFTPWDFNWPFGPPLDAIHPNPEGEPDIDEPKCETGDCPGVADSYVEERSRIYHEDIPIPGTGMTLHYSSSRVNGYQTTFSVPASGGSVPDSLVRIHVKVSVGGRTLWDTLPALPNQKTTIAWDGLDQLGRKVRATNAKVSVGFEYDLQYYPSNTEFEQAWAQAGRSTAAIAVRGRQPIIFWKTKIIPIYTTHSFARGDIADGWTLSLNHAANPQDKYTLYKGNGDQLRASQTVIETVMKSDSARTVSDSAGNIYGTVTSRHYVYKLNRDGSWTRIAGNGSAGFSGDGGPGTQAELDHPLGLDIDTAGNIYIADRNNHRIRKIDPDGIITTVAGSGPEGTETGGLDGDNGPATMALLNGPFDVACGKDGALFISDSLNHRIRKVDSNGIITTVAGSGSTGFYYGGFGGDNGPATQARLNNPEDVALDSAGNIYISDWMNYRIRKIDTSGIIRTVAGKYDSWGGDGGPATEAYLSNPKGIALDSDGSIYICDYGNYRLRKVDPKGIITTIAGGEYSELGDYGDPKKAMLRPAGVSIDPTGKIYIADLANGRIRTITKPLALRQAADSGDLSFADSNGQGYILSSTGRHKSTIDLDTGKTLLQFGYDEADRLISMTDRFENQTTIQRDADGLPLSITSPDGIVTLLTVDGNNHLTRVGYPDGSAYDFEYSADGLMTAEIDPRRNRFEHIFDTHGKLLEISDPAGGSRSYARSASTSGTVTTQVTTAEGDTHTYLDHTSSTGAYSSTITGATGAQTQFAKSANGYSVEKSLPCGLDFAAEYDLDREYKYSYVKEAVTTTPAGLTRTASTNRSYEDTDGDLVPDLIIGSVTLNGKTATASHNVFESQKVLTSPEGRTVTMDYDPNTLLTQTVSVPGMFDTAYGYDSRGRLTSVSTDTRLTTFTYDASGNLQAVTDPGQQTTTYDYDALGRMTGIHRPGGGSIAFAYDANGNMTVLTNPAEVNHGFAYDKVNLNSAYQAPYSGQYSYVYDLDRRLTQVNFPSGRQIENIYENGRLEQIMTPEGIVDLAYACDTQVGSIVKGTEQIGYGYDGYLLTAKTFTGTLNQSLSYAYNNDFSLTGFTYAGATENYAYDNDGLLISAGGYTITRNAANGLPEALSGGVLTTARTFNGYGELAAQDTAVSSRGVTAWSLIRDDNGRITGKTETVDGVTYTYVYTYDSMGRLRTVTRDGSLVEEYRYDDIGRTYEMNALRGITERSYTYSIEDHLLAAGDATYEYDLDGYLTAKHVGGETTQYTYSSRGELLNVTLPDGTLIEYVHGPMGQRIAKKVDGAIVEKFLWQGLTRLLAVYDGSDNLLMRFTYADARMPVAMQREGTTYYLTYDQVGSLRGVVDAAGNMVKQVDYDAFGNILNDTDPLFEMPFGFAGGLHDRDTGPVLFGYRDYDPDIGRWTAKDPIGFGGGDVDLYGYVINDPVNFIDPYGLDTYRINRKLGGDIAKRSSNPISHTYIATTDSNGNVSHTYSWGNTYDKQNRGLWNKDRPEDIQAANEALKKNWAEYFGDSTLDPFIDQEFNRLQNLPPGDRHKWNVFNNCKHEALNLYWRAFFNRMKANSP